MLLVIGDVDVHSSKSLRKFIEVDELVVVFVKLLENLNRIGLQVRVVLSWGLDLCDDCLKGSLWENVAVVLHVLLGVLI